MGEGSLFSSTDNLIHRIRGWPLLSDSDLGSKKMMKVIEE